MKIETAEEMIEPQSTQQNTMWMVTFTDLVSLMLTFFVMLFAMSSVKVDRWDTMVDTLSQSLNPESVKTVARTTTSFNIATIFRKRAINLDYLTVVLEETVAKDPLLKDSRIQKLQDRLVIALPGDILFQPGRALMTERAGQALFSLGGVLRNIGNQIAVNGHSDPQPPAAGEYVSNWELSLARAIAVANTLKRSGYPDDIIPIGFSDSQYGTLPDVADDRKRALARRVDIVIMPTVGD